MSLKFEKDRSVSPQYAKIPLRYTSINHPNNADKELVLMDYFGKHYVAAWRNNNTDKIGITFLLKSTPGGFMYKDKEYKHNRSGWVI